MYKKLSVLRPRAGALNDEDLAKVFVGREEELKRLESAILLKQNVLLCGTYGIGKTALLRFFLYRLKKRGLTTAYTVIPGMSEDDFLRAITYALAKTLECKSRKAKEIRKRMMGVEETAGDRVSFGGALLLRAERARVSTVTRRADFSKPYLVNTLSELIRAPSPQTVVIGADELDKRAPRDFNALIPQIRYVLEQDASFIVIGAESFPRLCPMASRRAGAFDRYMEVLPLDEEELVKLAKRYCKLIGWNPFEIEALEYLAEASFGVPRTMVYLCGHAIERSLDLGVKKITEEEIDAVLEEVGRGTWMRLTRAEQRVLEYVWSRGELHAVDRRAERDLAMSKSAIYQHLGKLCEKDALVEVIDESIYMRRVYRITPGISSFLKKVKT
jgi:DNA-binding transcriptional ArsR family regulator